MKKLLAGLLTGGLLLTSVSPVLAEEDPTVKYEDAVSNEDIGSLGETVVSYDIVPEYTVTIPASITTQNVKASELGKLVVPVSATIESIFGKALIIEAKIVELTLADESASISVTVGANDNASVTLTPKVNDDDEDDGAKYGGDMTFSLGKTVKSGTYTGKIVFTIEDGTPQN